ncbi:MAG: response regulator [Anaerolineae bacterium]|nr:response regulator [Anaerolineae bacterium]
MSSERVLVVDDGADMRDFVINYILRPNNYSYMEARDGLEALDLILADPPDLILLDLQMPRLDGVGLLNRMKEQGIAIPVVLMTFYGSEEIAIEVFRLGVRDYVIKPFTEGELLSALKRALTEARLRKQRETLYQTGKLVASLPDIDTLLLSSVEAAVSLAMTTDVTLVLISDDGQTLFNRVSYSNGQAQLVNHPVQNSLAWQAIRSMQPTAGQTQPRDPDRGIVPLCVPLVAGGIVFGVLAMTIPIDLSSNEQFTLLDSLADYIAIGLERARVAATSGHSGGISKA